MRFALPLIAALASGPAWAETTPAAAEEENVPFVNHGAVRDYVADGTEAIYFRGPGNRWYRGTFMHRCENLAWGNRIALDTRATGSLNRFSTVIVDGQRCPLHSLVRSEAPPRRGEGR